MVRRLGIFKLTPGLSGAGAKAHECKLTAPSRVRSRPLVRCRVSLRVHSETAPPVGRARLGQTRHVSPSRPVTRKIGAAQVMCTISQPHPGPPPPSNVTTLNPQSHKVIESATEPTRSPKPIRRRVGIFISV